MDLTPERRALFERGLQQAEGILEALFYGWLLKLPGSGRLYWEELLIAPLDDGPGGEADDFTGAPDSPDW